MTQANECLELSPKPSDYQPNKAELEEEFNMPGADKVTLRKA